MKQIGIVLIIFLISMGTSAQDDKNEGMEKHHETHNMSHDIDSEARAMIYADKMTTRLNLTLEQKEQIQQAEMKRLENQKAMMAEMMNESGNMRSDNGAEQYEKAKIMNNFKEEMKEILTASQYKEWEPMHDREMKMHGKEQG